MDSRPIRIAMWSGPRNISTALMRAWDSRADTAVCDEPFYAHYLAETGLSHPGRDEVLAAHEPDAVRVAAWLAGPVPGGAPIFYQKHMAHHLLPSADGPWLGACRHAFLIRDPREMLTSLARVLPALPRVEDTGLPQQWRLYARLVADGQQPPILDARDVLEHPAAMLQALCAALGVPWSVDMLAWEAGPRPTDGVWAKHWYGAVEASTGFAPYRPKDDALPPALEPVLAACEAIYERMAARRLRPTTAVPS